MARGKTQKREQPHPRIERTNPGKDRMICRDLKCEDQSKANRHGEQAQGQGNESYALDSRTITLVCHENITQNENDQIAKRTPSAEISSTHRFRRKADQHFDNCNRNKKEIDGKWSGKKVAKARQRCSVHSLKDRKHD